MPHSSAKQQFLIRIILLRRFTLSNTTQLIQCHVWLKKSLILWKHQDYFNGEKKPQTSVIIFGIIYTAVILWYEYKYKKFYTIACFFIDLTNKNFLCHFYIFSLYIYFFQLDLALPFYSFLITQGRVGLNFWILFPSASVA